MSFESARPMPSSVTSHPSHPSQPSQPSSRTGPPRWRAALGSLRATFSGQRTSAGTPNSIALALLNSLREPLAFVVRQGEQLVLTGGNPALERLLGRTAAEIVGLPLPRVLTAVPTGSGLALDRVEQAMLESTAARFRGHAIDRFGVACPVSVRVEPVGEPDAAGATQALVYLDPLAAELEDLRTVTGRLQASEEQLRRQAAQVGRLQQELNAFGSMLSHDLRAPLRTIDGFAQILAEDHADQLDRFARDHLNRIRTAGARMDRMIDALQDLSTLTAQAITSIPVDLSALARDVAADLARSRASPGARIVVAESLEVHGDPAMLRVLLQNLVDNALKFTARRADPLIEIGQVDATSVRPTFYVRDNGEGFDMRFAERLFGLFQRLHSADEFPGTGIGLATARRIVRRHGGEMWARGRPGEGACFYFTLSD